MRPHRAGQRIVAWLAAADGSWDTPAADFGERITTVEPESQVRLIALAPSGVAQTKRL